MKKKEKRRWIAAARFADWIFSADGVHAQSVSTATFRAVVAVNGLYMALHDNEPPSIAELAERTGLSERTVRRALNELELFWPSKAGPCD